MSNLPSLHLLLLLLGLGLQCPEAQGRPVTTTQNYDHLIHEIHMILNKSSTSIPQQTPSDIDKSILKEMQPHLPMATPQWPKDMEELGILMDKTLLTSNLAAFLKATEKLFNKSSLPICKNLKSLEELPKTSPIPTPEKNVLLGFLLSIPDNP
ncbi:interleukin-3-like [Trichechus inunguis]